jgi:single-strand DNA-binding protein
VRDIATATLSGNLTREVELHELPSGTEVARLRVGSTTRRRAGDVWVDKSNYFTVDVYGARARACAEHLAKGSRVVVEAELDWREWTDQENNRREAVAFRARQILFDGGHPDGSDPDEGGVGEDFSHSDAEPVGGGYAARRVGRRRRPAVLNQRDRTVCVGVSRGADWLERIGMHSGRV